MIPEPSCAAGFMSMPKTRFIRLCRNNATPYDLDARMRGQICRFQERGSLFGTTKLRAEICRPDRVRTQRQGPPARLFQSGRQQRARHRTADVAISPVLLRCRVAEPEYNRVRLRNTLGAK